MNQLEKLDLKSELAEVIGKVNSQANIALVRLQERHLKDDLSLLEAASLHQFNNLSQLAMRQAAHVLAVLDRKQ